MINLKEKPFYLNDDQVQWVEDTIKSMTVDEKINQLFIDMVYDYDPEELKETVQKYQPSGYRYMNLPPEKLREQNKLIQDNMKIPALIAANVEKGGNGAVSGGTEIGGGAAIGATQNSENAYLMGLYGCMEAAAQGCNWTFAPVVDIMLNWRNCIVADRAFGCDPKAVLENGLAYMRGAHEAGVACCMKHFPGDGVDERDQHIVTTQTDLTKEEWDKTFGYVYKGMIEAGVPSVMVGHIQMPQIQRMLRPGIKDEDIMPATLAPELLQDLLRDELGFNGLVITDASHMVGITSKMHRHEMVPTAIASGCDMFLYYRDKDEDVQAMKDALESGLLTMERLDEALTRVLGFKAMLNLPEKQKAGNLVPPEEDLVIVGSEKVLDAQKKIADESITLVKNTKNQLPISPEKEKKLIVYPLGFNGLKIPGITPEKSAVDMFVEKMTKEGFEVEVFDAREVFSNPKAGKAMLAGTSVKEFSEKYDAAIVLANIDRVSTSNERRIHWTIPMGPEIPWYVTVMPTIFISFNNPFHLIDVPMVPTYINAYSASEAAVDAVVDKLLGRSEFKGVSPVDAFCGAWDTRL